MSTSKWNYNPEECDYKPCIGDCDLCIKKHHENNLNAYAHDFDCTIEEAEKALRKGEHE